MIARQRGEYIEPIATFLSEDDEPVHFIFPELLPAGVIMLVHGEPRARKSLVGFELALSAATGSAPFGLDRFAPKDAINVLYIQEEDPRSLTRQRLRRIVEERCGISYPASLHVSVRAGINLDDPIWPTRIINDVHKLNVKLVVLDAARRLSSKTDEGPAKVRELMAVLRSIVTNGDVTLVVVHHDVKPHREGQDHRRRSQRASGGDWFAGCECPVHVERLSPYESLVYPEDYKFTNDPSPFTFSCQLDGPHIKSLVGSDSDGGEAADAVAREKLLGWLKANGPASRTAMKQAGVAWKTVEALVGALLKEGQIMTVAGRQAGAPLFVVAGAGETSRLQSSETAQAEDGSFSEQSQPLNPSPSQEDGSKLETPVTRLPLIGGRLVETAR